MLGAMNWTVTWFRPDGPDTAAAVGDVIARFLVRGVASRTPAVQAHALDRRASRTAKARS